MNGFDVRAIGWVVTRDACAEIAGALFGARRRVAADTFNSLGDRWFAVCNCLREDRRRSRGNLIQPLGTPVSAESKRAMEEFVLHLMTCCPQLYSEAVLRGRFIHAAAQAFIGFVGTTAGFMVNPERVCLGDVAIVLLIMACCCLISAIQLGRTYRVVKRVDGRHCAATRTSTAVID